MGDLTVPVGKITVSYINSDGEANVVGPGHGVQRVDVEVGDPAAAVGVGVGGVGAGDVTAGSGVGSSLEVACKKECL